MLPWKHIAICALELFVVNEREVDAEELFHVPATAPQLVYTTLPALSWYTLHVEWCT